MAIASITGTTDLISGQSNLMARTQERIQERIPEMHPPPPISQFGLTRLRDIG